MSRLPVLTAMLKADFLERTRRSSFLVTVCLVIYLGYAVNAGSVLIMLGDYRGLHNSAWVGSLMAIVVTFFLGLGGFYLVKNTIERDERSGVGQILATTPITRVEYLLGKWMSNFLVLSSLVGILGLAAVLMQLISREVPTIDPWALLAPLLFVALPMMALTAAFAVFFESVGWLKGGFGNLVYFGLFIVLIIAGVQFPEASWLDAVGFNVIGGDMRAAARAAFPAYDDTFVLSMADRKALQPFLYSGLRWTAGLILQRIGWVAAALGVTLASALFFRRFDRFAPSRPGLLQRMFTMGRSAGDRDTLLPEQSQAQSDTEPARLSPLAASDRQFRWNLGRLVWLEAGLLLKGQRWYWLLGMAGIWLGCALAPSQYRPFGFMLAAVWPVLVWSRMGERDARWQTGELLDPAPYATARLMASAWLAGVLVTALLESGVLAGRLLAREPAQLAAWLLAVVFIPSLALALGVWGRSSKLFEVLYPILWYLGPMNPQNSLTVLDYLGIHAAAPVNTTPLRFAGCLVLLALLAYLGRRWHSRA